MVRRRSADATANSSSISAVRHQKSPMSIPANESGGEAYCNCHEEFKGNLRSESIGLQGEPPATSRSSCDGYRQLMNRGRFTWPPRSGSLSFPLSSTTSYHLQVIPQRRPRQPCSMFFVNRLVYKRTMEGKFNLLHTIRKISQPGSVPTHLTPSTRYLNRTAPPRFNLQHLGRATLCEERGLFWKIFRDVCLFLIEW